MAYRGDFAESPFYQRQEGLRRERENKITQDRATTLKNEKKLASSGIRMSKRSARLSKDQAPLVPSLQGIISERRAEREQLALAQMGTPRRLQTPRDTSRIDKYADGLAWQERCQENQERLEREVRNENQLCFLVGVFALLSRGPKRLSGK